MVYSYVRSALALLGSLISFIALAEATTTDCAVSRGKVSNDVLQTWLPPDGKIAFREGGAGFVDQDGALGIKWPWHRLVAGALIIGGRRLDAHAAPARAYLNDGYGDRGFQASYLVFPTPGCWEITGRIANRSLTFVVQVEKQGAGPSWRYSLPSGGFWYQTTLEEGRTVPSSN